MKPRTQAVTHAGSNPIRIGGILNVCRMMRIDDTGKVLFRNLHLLGEGFQHREVPYVSVKIRTPDGEKVERYYFCRRYLVEGTVYLPYLFKSKHLEDKDVAEELPHILTAEDRVLEMRLSTDTPEHSGWSYEARKALFSRCIQKYYKDHPTKDVARMLFTTETTVRRALGHVTKVVVGDTADSDDATPSVGRLKDSPEYKAIQKEVHAARVKACNLKPPVKCSFAISDVLVRVNDVHGNSGKLGNERVVPKVCPVLRIPLDYNVFEDNKPLNKIRVWRKTPGPDGAAPLTPDNVIIMSKAAAWILEGAYGGGALRTLNDDSRNALADWQAKHGTRTVPREKKVGRPRKVQN